MEYFLDPAVACEKPAYFCGSERRRSRSRSPRSRCEQEKAAASIVQTALQASDAVFPLVRLLRDGSSSVRQEAVGALTEIIGHGDEHDCDEVLGSENMLQPVVDLLKDDQRQEGQRVACELLCHLLGSGRQRHAKVLAEAGVAQAVKELLRVNSGKSSNNDGSNSDVSGVNTNNRNSKHRSSSSDISSSNNNKRSSNHSTNSNLDLSNAVIEKAREFLKSLDVALTSDK
eukprot:TRINITY_DN6054_c2_g1_i1.p1 TRINITY_DN6054_c2_g1~~TRINITY_DN6054_c2_g1_i1.p1  ORF type:complete len:229 (+),score=54.04 TRINITY_DN6054_c2_g1_i1:56-742(+)